MSRPDDLVERASRWLAARLTRRSFLDRAAKLGIVVAGGPTLATFLADRAEARVCGQTGVTPRCPTFDCVGPGDVWGWCWYASPGCCTNGGLKKICDCCRVDYPNVHGYCPAGTNVRCIVESCWADPRVMTVPVARVGGFSAAALAAGRSAREHPRAGRDTAVLVANDGPLPAAVAAPVAAAAGAPLLVTGSGWLSGAAVSELQRLRVRTVLTVGPGLDGAVADDLASYGVAVHAVTSAPEPPAYSLEALEWLRARGEVHRAWCVVDQGQSRAAAPLAGAAAAAGRAALLVGIDAARQATEGPGGVAVTYLAGAEAAPHAGQIPGGNAVRGADLPALARAIAAVVVDGEQRRHLTLALLPTGSASILSGLAAAGVVLLHPDGHLDPPLLHWIADRPHAWARAVACGSLGTLGDPAYHDLQAAVNHFETRALTGVAGQGLPVFEQPPAERELGRARLASVPDRPAGSYWVARANPDR